MFTIFYGKSHPQTYEKRAMSKQLGGYEKTHEKAMAYNHELFIDDKKFQENSTILFGKPHGLLCMGLHGIR